MPSHQIQLKGPWEVFHPATPVDAAPPRSDSVTRTMPQGWRELFGDVGGTARFQRKFHRPSNLEPHERVFLVFKGIRGQSRISLNRSLIGEFVATGDAIEVDISSRMHSFNLIDVEIAFEPAQQPTLPGGLFGVVALDIRWDESSTK